LSIAKDPMPEGDKHQQVSKTNIPRCVATAPYQGANPIYKNQFITSISKKLRKRKLPLDKGLAAQADWGLKVVKVIKSRQLKSNPK
jgi:hypothetical protein